MDRRPVKQEQSVVVSRSQDYRLGTSNGSWFGGGGSGSKKEHSWFGEDVKKKKKKDAINQLKNDMNNKKVAID